MRHQADKGVVSMILMVMLLGALALFAGQANAQNNPGLPFEQLEAKLDELESVADNIEGKTDALEVKADALEAKADTLNSKADTLQTAAETIDGKVDAVQSTTGTINAGVESLEVKADALEAKADTLNSKADTLQTAAETIDGKVDALGLLEAKLDAIESKTDALETKLDDLPGGEPCSPCVWVSSFYESNNTTSPVVRETAKVRIPTLNPGNSSADVRIIYFEPDGDFLTSKDSTIEPQHVETFGDPDLNFHVGWFLVMSTKPLVLHAYQEFQEFRGAAFDLSECDDGGALLRHDELACMILGSGAYKRSMQHQINLVQVECPASGFETVCNFAADFVEESP